MSTIRILSEAVANKIAAGEVVERPASVIKELVENSLDAGASRIEVMVEAGGKRLMRVVDDGCGMSHDDALLAFERHATSKIKSAEDLFEIATLGFRGEALPSIAAVSRLVLETRHHSEPSGSFIEFAGGKLCEVKEIAWSAGTRVEVKGLLFNTPARRKFLKSESTELGHIANLLTHYALAHPEKSFRLSSLSNDILDVAPVGTHRERIYQTMGGQLLSQLVEIAPQERPMPASSGFEAAPAGEKHEPGVARVSGFVSRPEVEKLNRNDIYFFVNRRLVRDRLILHAITEAYRNILPGSVFPVVLVFLELPPAEVDVNVHPSKTEVRFRHSGFIHDLVRDSIRQALLKARPVAAFPVTTRRSAHARIEEEAEITERLQEDITPAAQQDGNLVFGTTGSQVADDVQGLTGTPPSQGAVASQDFRLTAPSRQPRTGDLPLGDAGLALDTPAAPRPVSTQARSSSDDVPSNGGRSGPTHLDGAAVGPGADSQQVGETAVPVTSMPGEFPADLNPLGQIQQSFIVATNADGLWLVDQHVAHERILFERHLRLCRQNSVEGQRILLPIIVELRPDQETVFQNIAEELRANGFEVEPFGRRTVAIKTAPADIRADDAERLLLEILDGEIRESRAISLDELRTRIAASVACHSAVKANMPLERNKMQWLLRELSKTQCPMSCPHGRPIVLRYGMKEIQRAFRRT